MFLSQGEERNKRLIYTDTDPLLKGNLLYGLSIHVYKTVLTHIYSFWKYVFQQTIFMKIKALRNVQTQLIDKNIYGLRQN